MMRGIWRRQLALAVALGAAWIVAAHFVLLPLTAAWLPETGLLLIGGLLLWRWVERTARRQEREIERQAELARRSLENGQPLPVLAGELAETLVAELRPVWDERERRQAASQMRAERLHAILESLDTAVVAAAADRRVIFANSAAARLLHWGTPPAAGERLTALPRIAQLEQWASEVITAAAPAGGRLRLPDERTLQVVLTPLEGGGFVLLAHDMTETSRLETLRRDFIAGVSHELRTPLASIQGYAETLIESANERPAQDIRFLNIILANVRRLTRLASDLVMLTSLETGTYPFRFQWVDTAALASPVVAELQPLAAEHQSELIADEIEPVRLWLDPDAWHRVLLNLAENALVHNRPGVRVRIRGQRREQTYRWEVADNGVGIGWSDQPRVFERFYRIDPSRGRERGGSGLGLALVKHIVLDHGGRVELESELNQGCRFTVELPLLANNAPPPPELDPAVPDPAADRNEATS